MPALGFRARFAPKIESGEKAQTMRASRRDGRPHCKPGDRIGLFTGMRTKQCRKLGTALVHKISVVALSFSDQPNCEWATIGDDRGAYNLEALNAFARLDGFADWADMKLFFGPRNNDWTWIGVLIEWKDFQKPCP